jgi:hypothetical protein
MFQRLAILSLVSSIPLSFLGGVRGGLGYLFIRSVTKKEEKRREKGKVRFPLESRVRIYVFRFTLNFIRVENGFHLGAVGGQQ